MGGQKKEEAGGEMSKIADIKLARKYGREAGYQGKPKSDCPKGRAPEIKAAWLHGWDIGRRWRERDEGKS